MKNFENENNGVLRMMLVLLMGILLLNCGEDEKELAGRFRDTIQGPWRDIKASLPTDDQGATTITNQDRALAFSDGMTISYDGTNRNDETVCRKEEVEGVTYAVCMGLQGDMVLTESSAIWNLLMSEFDGDITCTVDGTTKNCATEVYPKIGEDDSFSCEPGVVNGDKALKCTDDWAVVANGQEDQSKTVCRVHLSDNSGRCLGAPKKQTVTNDEGAEVEVDVPPENLVLEMLKSSWGGYRSNHFRTFQVLEGERLDSGIVANLPIGSQLVYKSLDENVCTVDNDGSDGETGSITIQSGSAPDSCEIILQVSAPGFVDRVTYVSMNVVHANNTSWTGYDAAPDFYEGEWRSAHTPTGTPASAKLKYRSMNEAACTVDRDSGQVTGADALGDCIVVLNSSKAGFLEVEIESNPLEVNEAQRLLSFTWSDFPILGMVGTDIDLSSGLPVSDPVADQYDISVLSGDCLWEDSGKVLSFQDVSPCKVRATAIKHGYWPESLDFSLTPERGTFAITWTPATTGTVGTDLVLNAVSGVPDGTEITYGIKNPGSTGCAYKGSSGANARTLTFGDVGTCIVTAFATFKGYAPSTTERYINVSPGTLGAVTWGSFTGNLKIGGTRKTPATVTGAGLAQATVEYSIKPGSEANCHLSNANTGEVEARAVALPTGKICTVVGRAIRVGYTTKAQEISINLEAGDWTAAAWSGYGGNTGTYGAAAPTLTSPTSTPTADNWIYSSSTGTVCSVARSSGTLTIKRAGDCIITAAPEKLGYPQHDGIEKTISIGKADQAALSTSSWSEPYGATPSVAVGETLSIDHSGGPSGEGDLQYQVESGDTSYCSVDSRSGAVTAQIAGTGEDCVIQARYLGDANYNPSGWVTIATISVTEGVLGNIVWGSFSGNLQVGGPRQTPTPPTGTGTNGATIQYALKSGSEANCHLRNADTGQVEAKSVDLSTIKTCTVIGTASRAGYGDATSGDISILLAEATTETLAWGSFTGTLQVGGVLKTPSPPTGSGASGATIRYALKSGSETNCHLRDADTGQVEAKAVDLTTTQSCTIIGTATHADYGSKTSGDISINLSKGQLIFNTNAPPSYPEDTILLGSGLEVGNIPTTDDNGIPVTWSFTHPEQYRTFCSVDNDTNSSTFGDIAADTNAYQKDICTIIVNAVTDILGYDSYVKQLSLTLTKPNPVQIVSGISHSCVNFEGGGIKCWGNGVFLGLGSKSNRGHSIGEMGSNLPFVNLGERKRAKSIAAGNQHTCAILNDDSLKCWGSNGDGQLGYGDTDIRIAPEATTVVNLGSGKTAKAISTGGSHTCAILNDGSLKCWGNNGNGQLGYEDTTQRNAPETTMVVNLGSGKTAKAISAGGGYTCAILNDDSLKCWGSNGFGATWNTVTPEKEGVPLVRWEIL